MEAIAKTLTMSEVHRLELEETIKNEKNKLFSFIRKRVGSNEDAEDILQDSLLQLVSAYQNAGSIEKVVSWLYTVARNKITDSYRKRKTETMPVVYTGEGEEVLFLQDILPDLSSAPEDMLMREMIWEEVQQALDELPSEQRDVFVAHEFEDISFKELSEKMGETVNTLLSRKRYAILYMRKKLKDLYESL